MKKTKIIYWIVTILFSISMLFASIPYIMRTPDTIALVKDHLGYPLYIIPFMGVAKLLGVIIILIPGFPRLKEWAYAGFAIDLFGATYSIMAVGEPANHWGFMFIFIGLGAASYIYYHKNLKNQKMLTP